MRGDEESGAASHHKGETPWTVVSADGMEYMSGQAHIIGFMIGYGGRQFHNFHAGKRSSRRNQGHIEFDPALLPAFSKATLLGWDDHATCIPALPSTGHLTTSTHMKGSSLGARRWAE